MCGIFGFNAKTPANADELSVLAMYNDVRGGHATGFYSDRSGIVKDNVDAFDFCKKYHKKFDNSRLFMGHTRYGTHGKNIVRNAHPFKYGKTIGTHNGVIWNYDEVARKFGKKVEVDSECIFLAIENTKDETKVLPTIQGAMAIAYTRGDELNLFRRDNPLFIGYNTNGMYYSSMEDSLEAILCYDIFELPENEIYTFSYGECVDIRKVKSNRTTFKGKAWYEY